METTVKRVCQTFRKAELISNFLKPDRHDGCLVCTRLSHHHVLALLIRGRRLGSSFRDKNLRDRKTLCLAVTSYSHSYVKIEAHYGGCGNKAKTSQKINNPVLYTFRVQTQFYFPDFPEVGVSMWLHSSQWVVSKSDMWGFLPSA